MITRQRIKPGVRRSAFNLVPITLLGLMLALTVPIGGCGGGGGSNDVGGGGGDGGGDDGDGDGSGTKSPPVFTSATSGTSPENGSDPPYTATAEDADGDTPAFSIEGGADASAFSVDGASGVLSFKSAPDYENPQDADGDNAYVVELGASDGYDGPCSRWTSPAVTGSSCRTTRPAVARFSTCPGRSPSMRPTTAYW